MTKLPSANEGGKFTLDDEVALKFYRLQQMSEGTINLGGGEADPLKGQPMSERANRAKRTSHSPALSKR